MAQKLERDYLMTPKDVADFMGVSMTTVSRHMNEEVNPLPSIRISNKVVRVRYSSFISWLDSRVSTSKEYIQRKK